MAERLPSLMIPAQSWLRATSHRLWLGQQGQRLLDFSKASRVDKGFGPLDRTGCISAPAEPDTTLTARMTHVYAISGMRGIPGSYPLAEHGVASLLDHLRDRDHDGWFGGLVDGNPSITQTRKQNYLHAFIVLAASSAVVAQVPRAEELLEQAISVWETHFWSDKEGVFRESFSADWSDEENYRGANSNMHSVEACLAAADVTGNPAWRQKAQSCVERFIHDLSRDNGYHVREHYDRQWNYLPDYNHDRPADDLRPSGMTPGHFAEWSHLVLKLEAALLLTTGHAPDWLLQTSINLFESAVTAGWNRTGSGGMLYTVDNDINPIITNKPHWCQAEALCAASALLKRTGHYRYEEWYRTIWDFIDLHMIDRVDGGWIQELDENNVPSEKVYAGKADLYHAWQATLTPLLPLSPSFATAARELY